MRGRKLAGDGPGLTTAPGPEMPRLAGVASAKYCLVVHGRIPYNLVMAISTRHKVLPHREAKRERIELRVGASAKQLIRRAMAVSGLTAGDLAYEGARKVLDEHERMVLTGNDREAFLKAV